MRYAPALLLLAGVMACEKIGSGGGTSASKTDSIAILNTKLAQSKAVAAQQDSLLQGFQQTTQLLADIDKELSNVKGLKTHVPLETKGEAPSDPQAAYRASLVGEGPGGHRAPAAEPRPRPLAGREEQHAGRAGRDDAADDRQLRADRRAEQGSRWPRSTSRWTACVTVNTEVTAQKAAVTDTMLTLRKQENTVYYVVGTKEDLMKKGIVAEEGSKFLFFGSKALVPARKIDKTQFTAMNKWDDVPIVLHIADKPYKVVSRQDAQYIEAGKDSTGKFNGELHITQPAEFWSHDASS